MTEMKPLQNRQARDSQPLSEIEGHLHFIDKMPSFMLSIFSERDSIYADSR